MSIAAQVARASQLIIDQAITAAKSLVTPVVNVQGYGAKGDGTTNDTAAVQAALDVGGVTFFPPGIYLVTNLTVDRQDAQLVGSGITLTQIIITSTTGDGIRFGNAVTPRYTCAMRDMRIVGGGNRTSGALVRFLNLHQSKIADCRIQLGYDGFVVENCTQINTTNLEISDNTHFGMQMWNVNDLYAVNVHSDVNGIGGFSISGAGGLYMVNCSAYGNTNGPGFRFDNTIATSHWCFFTNCIGDTSFSYNWQIEYVEGCYLSNCWGSTQGAGGSVAGSGFFVGSTALSVCFTNCTAHTNNKHGFEISSATNVRLIGCQATNNGQKQGGSSGIYAEFGSGVVIEACQVLDNQTVKKQAYGITTAGTLTDYIITGNFLKGNLTSSLNDLASGVSKVVANNLT